MIASLITDRENRAVSPLFRAFGRYDGPEPGERRRRGAFPGTHPGECLTLGLIFPGMIGVAVSDALWRWAGMIPSLLLVLPATFVVLHVLAFGLRLKTPKVAFWGWTLLVTVWAEWMLWRGGETPVRWVAWAWMSFVVVQFIAVVVLAWRGLMKVSGTPGVAVRIAIAVGSHVLIWPMVLCLGWTTGLAYAVALAAFWGWGTFRPTSQLFGPIAKRITGDGVLLTFDDGPDPRDTPAILDLLDRYETQAVFFVIGEKVREFPELAREILSRGHEIGNHTMTHPQASMWGLGPSRTRREIEDCQKAVEEVTGIGPKWFRAPVGHRNWFTHPVTLRSELELVAWSRRAFDTVGSDVGKLTARLTDGVSAGDILLLHESTPVAIELAERVLTELKRLSLLPARSDDC